MKTKRFFSAMLLTWLVVISLGASQTRAELQVSFSWFQDSLAPYGEWVTIDDYGPAWHPLAVDETWSPYLDGYWAYTDDGWTWISDEPWADVTYHYGRWTAVDGYGWCWVPGYEWAPAWVSWRANDEYVGWAPLPPEALWQPATGISVWADVRYDIGPAYYHFCHTRDFGERNLRNVVISRDRNTTVIINTTNITNINYLPSENRIFNGGPVLTYVEQRSARPIPRYRIEDHSTFQRSRVDGDAYIAMRPRFNAANRSAGPSLGRSASRHIPQAQVTHGWRHSALPEEQRHIQERMHAEVRGLTPENTPARHVVHRDGGLVPAALAEMRQRAESSARDRQPADSRSSRAGTIPLSPRTPTLNPTQTRPTVSTPPKPIERKEGASKASSSRPQRIDEPHKGPARPSTHPMPATKPESPRMVHRPDVKPSIKPPTAPSQRPPSPPKRSEPTRRPEPSKVTPPKVTPHRVSPPKIAPPKVTPHKVSPPKASPHMPAPSTKGPSMKGKTRPEAPQSRPAPSRPQPQAPKPAFKKPSAPSSIGKTSGNHSSKGGSTRHGSDRE